MKRHLYNKHKTITINRPTQTFLKEENKADVHKCKVCFQDVPRNFASIDGHIMTHHKMSRIEYETFKNKEERIDPKKFSF